ncbi:MAG: phosphatase, partial [Actinomycetota bacterium]
RRRVRYLDGVAVRKADVDLIHTHESWPKDALLDAIEAPDLVLADHGWAGAAIARGVEVACFTDVNDPAIAVAKADGLVEIVVPCDDNLPPVVYEPVRDYLVALVG